MRATLQLAAAVAWRRWWAMEDRVRGMVWGRRLGFDLRPRPTGAVARLEQVDIPLEEPSVTSPRSDRIVVVGGERLLVDVGRLYGLDVEAVPAAAADESMHRALADRVPLVAIAAASGSAWAKAAALYVRAGGSLFLHSVTAGDDGVVALETAIGRPLPRRSGTVDASARVRFSARERSLTREFAGATVAARVASASLGGLESASVIATAASNGTSRPVASETRLGSGRIVVSAGIIGSAPLSAALEPLDALGALPAMMLIRQTYGDVAWRAPRRYANFVVDDPALRHGRLGLDYRSALSLAREHGFHLTVATIPRELGLADQEVVGLLRKQRRWLSACFHGSDHNGYEFYLPVGGHMRYRARSIESQERSLRRAVARGEEFARLTGLALDRVMVFPYGVGSSAVLRSLQDLGFLAACNYDDRYPLGADVPSDFDLGMRPADLAWSGFPLMWRRGLADPMFLLDLFFGRPAITFAHPKSIGSDFGAFIERADDINHAVEVHWSGLEDIARHSYLERRDPEGGWRVAMTANEICLHNPDPRPRTYSVTRPHMPEGSFFVVDDVPAGDWKGVEVTVSGGGVCSVVLSRGSIGLPSRAADCVHAVEAEQRSTA